MTLLITAHMTLLPASQLVVLIHLVGEWAPQCHTSELWVEGCATGRTLMCFVKYVKLGLFSNEFLCDSLDRDEVRWSRVRREMGCFLVSCLSSPVARCDFSERAAIYTLVCFERLSKISEEREGLNSQRHLSVTANPMLSQVHLGKIHPSLHKGAWCPGSPAISPCFQQLLTCSVPCFLPIICVTFRPATSDNASSSSSPNSEHMLLLKLHVLYNI